MRITKLFNEHGCFLFKYYIQFLKHVSSNPAQDKQQLEKPGLGSQNYILF